MTLSEYHRKRNFSQTTEPKGTLVKSKTRLFVIQKHEARHLHYDFRLELQGVLKSWAIPKGPSLNPKIKRLAVQVEDHPVDYGSFEGIIPKGQYGGGTVMLWDTGSWLPLDKDPYQAYKKGHLRFELQAKKLNGRWDLIRFKDNNHWFLIKYQDDFADEDYGITEMEDKSVKTQQTMDEIREHYQSIWSSNNSKEKSLKSDIKLSKNLKKSAFPDFKSPQLATLVDKPPEGKQWLHEIKFDGYRILAFKKGAQILLKSRNNKEWTAEFNAVAKAVAELPYENVILDGEVVVLDKKGRSNFQLLQNSIKSKKPSTLIYFIFDILYFDQFDLTKLPLIERKTILKQLLSSAPNNLHYSNHLLGEGKALYDFACEQGLEGIIAKQAKSTYLPKTTKTWLKIKCIKRQEFVIGGYSKPKGGRSYLGSLFLGVYNEQNQLDFVGNVGTGFNQKSLKDIYELLEKEKSQKNPFTTNPPGYSQAQWVKPKLICEIEFTEWTKDKHLRHPSFKGLRFDKQASEVVYEKEMPIKETAMPPKITLTNPEKILYPEDKITKKELVRYYEEISDYILPFIRNRPLTLLRCPANYSECFYQRHFNKTTASALHPIKIEGLKEKYIYLDDINGLLSLVQMGVLEIHPWGSTIKQIDQPNLIIFDLDPAPEVPWKRVVAAAKELRDYLAQYKLRSFVKTTGGKGLHVVIPIKPENDWDSVKEFSKIFVYFLENLKPNEYISNMSKTKRAGKIFIDYLRNQKGATAIAAYSTRARLHAPVSTPLAWDELSTRIEDNYYTIKTLPNRLKHLTEDPWKDFWELKQSLIM